MYRCDAAQSEAAIQFKLLINRGKSNLVKSAKFCSDQKESDFAW
jgi:hypothetical protein